MANEISELLNKFKCKIVEKGKINGSINAPIIARGYNEDPIYSEIAIAMLDKRGYAALSQTEMGVTGEKLLDAFLAQNSKEDDISVIITGTSKMDILSEFMSFFSMRMKNVQTHFLDANHSGTIDVAINPLEKKLLIYRSYNDETIKLDFWKAV